MGVLCTGIVIEQQWNNNGTTMEFITRRRLTTFTSSILSARMNEGMLPQENFFEFDALRWLLGQLWSLKNYFESLL